MKISKTGLMPSIADTEYITLTEACKLIPGRPHRNTVIRWCDRGYNGIILKSWRCGNRRVTNIPAIDDFLAETSGIKGKNPHRASLAHQCAEAQLDAMSI